MDKLPERVARLPYAQVPSDADLRAFKAAGTVVLMDVLKGLECEFSRRGMLDRTEADNFNPCWFLAETERNIYLWRSGRSIINEDEFEFWVDVPALVEKRLRQLAACDDSNPFVNPLWGYARPDPDSAVREQAYLASFLDSFLFVHTHAHALSKAASLLNAELKNEPGRRPVVLPTGGAREYKSDSSAT